MFKKSLNAVFLTPHTGFFILCVNIFKYTDINEKEMWSNSKIDATLLDLSLVV